MTTEIKPVSYTSTPAEGQGQGGALDYFDDTGRQLIDGKTGTNTWWEDLGNGMAYEWVGWAQHDPTITFEFAQSVKINHVLIDFAHAQERDGIYLPINVTINHKTFQLNGNEIPENTRGTLQFDGAFTGSSLSISMERNTIRADPSKWWIFIDEVKFTADDSTSNNSNHLPTGDVTITGVTTNGETLTATNTLADADGLGTITYQWKADGIDLGTGNTYTLTSNEVGKAITATASYTDLLGTAESVASSATQVVTDIPPVSGNPGINIAGTDVITSEQGDTALFNVTLNSAPNRDVTINFSSSDTTEGIVTGNPALTFTAANWFTPQSFTVTGQNDILVDGNVAYSINAEITTLDIFYKSVITDTLTLTNQDTPIAKVETLTGTNGMDVLKGTPAPTYILGEAADDDLSGGAGNDTIYGSYGNDLLFGEDDNDTLYGEQDADYLDGGTGNDVLDGGLGLDTLVGGAGNETYYLGYDAIDVIDDQGLSTDVDTVIMPYQLSKYTLPTGIEQGTIADGTQSSNLTGNASDNTLTGNDGKNTLSGAVGRDALFGGLGNDVLIGGSGNDTLGGGTGGDKLTGGAGKDSFVFDTALKANVDKITDFKPVNDTLQLDHAVFAKLTVTGVIDTGLFVKGTAPHDSNDYLIYNPANGSLSYDADGSGAGTGIQIAMLGINLPLTNADFVVI